MLFTCFALVAFVTSSTSELITVTKYPSACRATYSNATTIISPTPSATRDAIPEIGEEESSTPRLPYNLDTQFGGLDATQALGDSSARHPNLFRISNLKSDEYTYPDPSVWTWGTTSYEEHFKYPSYLSFDWRSNFLCDQVSGESKASYLSELSIKLGGNAAVDGFGVEFKDTFSESDYVETYQKYASMYCRYERYTVSVIEDNLDDLRKYLTPQAEKVFREQDAATIVNTFGTHYMKSAVFGGVKRFASKIDVRDETVAEDLSSALGFNVAETETGGNETSGKKSPDSFGFDISIDTKSKQEVHSQMETSHTEVIGGTYVPGGDEQWAFSLYRNPSIIKLTLAPLSDLISNSTKSAAVQQEIDRRMSASGISDKALALVTFNDLEGQANDAGSGSHQRIMSARTKPRENWKGLGHYALTGGDAYGWDPTKSQGLLISNVDNNKPVIKEPSNLNRVWGMSSRHNRAQHMGLYEMSSTDPDYVALSGFFLRTDSASTHDIPDTVMVHKSLVEPAVWGGALDWNDRHTGAHGSGQVTQVDYATFDPAKRIMHRNEDMSGAAYPEAFFFHSNNGYGAPGFQPYKLNFSAVHCLSNCWVGMTDCPPAPC